MKTLIIPAAGLATRLRPISNVASKCMVPVNGKPTISYILDSVGFAFDNIVIVYGKNDDVVNYVKTKYPEHNVSFVKQENPSGPLHAVHLGIESIDNSQSVTVWLGDTIIGNVQKYSLNNDSLFASIVGDYERWCMVSPNGQTLYDKPTEQPPTKFALIGVYNFSDFSLVKSLCNAIINSGERVRGEFQLSQLISAYNNVYSMSVTDVDLNDWYDTGDLPSLYDSSARLLQSYACRPDSNVKIDTQRGTFTKVGDRVKNEINWYRSIPESVKPFVPSVYSHTENSYTMELLNGTTVANMLLYESLSADTIRYIIRRCLEAYKLAFFEKPTKNRSADMLIDMHLNRVRTEKYYSFEQRAKYIDHCVTMGMTMHSGRYDFEVSCIHGDYHLGNIMFFPENGRVKFIDPRGNWGGVKTTSGNVMYDMIKFAQSIVGEYIWIYEGLPVNQNVKTVALDEMTKFFEENGIDSHTVIRHVPILMGSILEFHTDSPKRQKRIMQKTIELI